MANTRQTFDIGQRIRIENETTVAGTLTDPSTSVFTLRDPSGNTTTPTVSSDETGVSYVEVDCDEAGVFYWTWVTTGVNTGRKGSFEVNAADF